ncbi:unnamed protein product, partial [Scytosiphon promiscuus]
FCSVVVTFGKTECLSQGAQNFLYGYPDPLQTHCRCVPVRPMCTRPRSSAATCFRVFGRRPRPRSCFSRREGAITPLWRPRGMPTAHSEQDTQEQGMDAKPRTDTRVCLRARAFDSPVLLEGPQERDRFSSPPPVSVRDQTGLFR